MSGIIKNKSHAGRPSKVDEFADSLNCRWEGCLQPFPTIAEARAHEAVHAFQAKDDYQCKIQGCFKDFPNSCRLRKHLILHSPKNFLCEQCDKRFHEEQKLKRHEAVVHVGEKPFSCPVCQREFAFKANLKTHQRVHTGVKPFPCTVAGCRKTFAQASNRNAHEKTHKTNQADEDILSLHLKKRSKVSTPVPDNTNGGSLTLLAEQAAGSVFFSPPTPSNPSLLSPFDSLRRSVPFPFTPISSVVSPYSSTSNNTSSSGNHSILSGSSVSFPMHQQPPQSQSQQQQQPQQLLPHFFSQTSSSVQQHIQQEGFQSTSVISLNQSTLTNSSGNSGSSGVSQLYTPSPLNNFSTDSMGSSLSSTSLTRDYMSPGALLQFFSSSETPFHLNNRT